MSPRRCSILVPLLFVALTASALTLLARWGGGIFTQLDARLKDLRFTLTTPPPPDPRVVIVAVDNRSIKEIGRWPWPRRVTAELIRRTTALAPRVVALDILFSEPENPTADRALAEAIAEGGNVILGYFFRHEPQPLTPTMANLLKASALTDVTLAPGTESVPIVSFPHVDATIDSIAPAGIDAAFFNQIPDPDGIYRRSLLTILHEGDLYGSLALKGTALFLGGEIRLDLDRTGVRSLSVAGVRVPSRPDGTLTIPWLGPGGTVPTISAADILAGRVDSSRIRDKLVFVGFTEKGIYDLRATPPDPALPGVEIHATVASALLCGRFVDDSRTVQNLETVLVVLLPLLLALLLTTVRKGWQGGILLLVVSGGYAIVNVTLFDRLLVDLSPGFPLASLALSFVGCELYRNLVVERQGRYLQKAFSSYVSPELVAELVKNPDRLRLGGEKRTVTVLFSDIRGFTTLSESLPPETLVTILNRYLSPMTRIVLDERGMLDKYVGDAIMAVYNAPLPIPGHADHACRSALAMVKRLEELNREFVAEGLPRLAIGIGINTGDAVVGNMGAESRFDYTAIGDTVNLASRLEGMTKLYGVSIIISDGTRQALSERFHTRELDLVRVKGKSLPVAIFELREAPCEREEEYRRGLQAYRQGDFRLALEIFGRLPDDPVVTLYRRRCGDYLEHPPPEGWDGVYTAREK